MIECLLCGLFALSLCYWFLKFHVENGFYFPISRKYGARRYVFPKDEATIKKLNSECRYICRQIINGDVLKYPFLDENTTSVAFSKRIITMYYARGDASETPIAFHAPFVFTWENQRGLHCGLMMVVPEHQKQGLQRLSALSIAFYFLFRGVDLLTEITGCAAGASYLTIQDVTQCDPYPLWRRPEVPPKPWHLEVTRFMLKHYRAEFGCSRLATLDETKLVVNNSNAKEGDGCWQLMAAFDPKRSTSPAKQRFINNRFKNNVTDEQFFVGRPDFWKWVLNSIGINLVKKLD